MQFLRQQPITVGYDNVRAVEYLEDIEYIKH